MCTLAAKKLGCTLQTIHNRAATTPSIRQAIEDARDEMIDIAEQKLKQAILNGEPWAIALVLKTLGKTRGYIENPSVAVGVNVGGDTIVENVIIHLPDNGR